MDTERALKIIEELYHGNGFYELDSWQPHLIGFHVNTFERGKERVTVIVDASKRKFHEYRWVKNPWDILEPSEF